jgi:hypothetical protein
MYRLVIHGNKIITHETQTLLDALLLLQFHEDSVKPGAQAYIDTHNIDSLIVFSRTISGWTLTDIQIIDE